MLAWKPSPENNSICIAAVGVARIVRRFAVDVEVDVSAFHHHLRYVNTLRRRFDLDVAQLDPHAIGVFTAALVARRRLADLCVRATEDMDAAAVGEFESVGVVTNVRVENVTFAGHHVDGIAGVGRNQIAFFQVWTTDVETAGDGTNTGSIRQRRVPGTVSADEASVDDGRRRFVANACAGEPSDGDPTDQAIAPRHEPKAVRVGAGRCSVDGHHQLRGGGLELRPIGNRAGLGETIDPYRIDNGG